MQEDMLIKHCEILQKCMKSYSQDTTMKVVDILLSYEQINKIYEILKTNPTEQEFLKQIQEL